MARELVLLKHGGLLIDNPGIREIQMWTDEHTLRESFADLTELAHECRFADCSHGKDAGCAIRKAVEEGRLDKERYLNFLESGKRNFPACQAPEKTADERGKGREKG